MCSLYLSAYLFIYLYFCQFEYLFVFLFHFMILLLVLVQSPFLIFYYPQSFPLFCVNSAFLFLCSVTSCFILLVTGLLCFLISFASLVSFSQLGSAVLPDVSCQFVFVHCHVLPPGWVYVPALCFSNLWIPLFCILLECNVKAVFDIPSAVFCNWVQILPVTQTLWQYDPTRTSSPALQQFYCSSTQNWNLTLPYS